MANLSKTRVINVLLAKSFKSEQFRRALIKLFERQFRCSIGRSIVWDIFRAVGCSLNGQFKAGIPKKTWLQLLLAQLFKIMEDKN